MALQVYIDFKGNCLEAVNYYAEVFGTGKPEIMTYGQMPPNPDFEMSEELKNQVLHAELTINESVVMFSDVTTDKPFIQGNNINLMFNSKNLDEIRRVFNRLKEDGKVEMELQETFYSKCYGFLIDKFGVGWQFYYSDK